MMEVSKVIDRPVSAVFAWYADDHIRNHPRWDPDIELEATSPQPLGVGSVIRRWNSRSGTRIEGEMEIVEFERDRLLAMVIRDGPMEMHGRATFQPAGDGATILTLTVDPPGMVDEAALAAGIEGSLRKMKQMIEAEVPLPGDAL